MNPLLIAALLYYLFINVILFFTMGFDKRQAKKGRWRISEATLFLLAFLGGGLGGFLSMQVFHHKTHKFKFYMIFFICINIHFVVFYLLLGKLIQ